MGRPNKYPDQFRTDALELLRTSQRPIAEVARSLGIAGHIMELGQVGP